MNEAWIDWVEVEGLARLDAPLTAEERRTRNPADRPRDYAGVFLEPGSGCRRVKRKKSLDEIED